MWPFSYRIDHATLFFMPFSRYLYAILLGSLLFLNGIPTQVNACDPLGCLVINKDQDILALVTITQVEKENVLASIDHVYSSRLSPFKKQLPIRLEQNTSWGLSSPQINDHYFISLSCSNERCVTKWGAWQVDSQNFKTARLLHIRFGDDAAIQWLMNGNGSEFYGDENKMFARTAQGDIEIYPAYPSGFTTSQISKKQSALWLSKLLAGISLISIAAFIITKKYSSKLKRS
jgi:hypothetical protein